MLIHNSDGESTAIGPEATSPEKEEKDDLNNEKQKQIEPERKPSSKASDQQSKRSSSVKKEALTSSNSERLHLPAVRTQSVSSERTVSATPVKGLSNVRAGAMYSFILRALFECISRPLFHFVLVLVFIVSLNISSRYWFFNSSFSITAFNSATSRCVFPSPNSW